MNIHTFPLQRSTIEDFAEKHCLVMEVHERSPHEPVFGGWRGGAVRFYAHFSCCEIADNGCLVGVFGDGPSPEAAIADYGKQISGRRLIHRAYQPERKEIAVPIIVRSVGVGNA